VDLTLALPKGRLLPPAVDLFRLGGWDIKISEDDGPVAFPWSGGKVLVIRDDDVPTYVAYGAADLGIVGKDVLEEEIADVYELLDLGFGYCRLVLALPRSQLDAYVAGGFKPRRIATKYPKLTMDFCRRYGIDAEVIKVHGAAELTPMAGLSEAVSDLVATGRSMARAGLVEVEQIMVSTARLIANPASYRVKRSQLMRVVESLQLRGSKEDKQV
jgi:ATP phosphoribosyltransferase